MIAPGASLLAIAVLLGTAAGVSAGSGSEMKDPAQIFQEFVRPLEKAMGIQVTASKAKLGLLSGDITMKRIGLKHPVQGQVLEVRQVSFPFGAIAGLTDPAQCCATVGELELELDFGKERFWYVQDGPVKGAPDLSIAKLHVQDGRIHLADGDAPGVLIEGFSGDLTNLALPGEIWSAGKVPQKTWARASITGGTASLTTLPVSLQDVEATARFQGRTLQLEKLVARHGSGTVTLSGNVQVKKGRPELYDLTLVLEDVYVDRNLVAGKLSGTLTISGPPGQVKVKGSLNLEDATRFKKGKWKLPGCQGSIELGVKIQAPSHSPGTLLVKGALCNGKIVK